MKKILKHNLMKKIFLIVCIVYVAIIFINQQKTINSYNSQQEYYTAKIKSAEEYNASLVTEKSNLNSEDYIEKIAREKLNMYAENERVYIDISK